MAGIYLHIPFCKTRCIYCDFYSTTSEALQDRYIDALCAELRLRHPYLKGEPVRTLYFGGGTPSQLKSKHFEAVFNTIESVYGTSACEEITLEANPDDLTQAYVEQLRALPFNRVSIGIQTFDEAALKQLRRRHTAQQAIEAVRRCREAGFRNISIDLIYGLPGETVERWNADLRQAIDLDVEHISAYHLTYEEGTPLYSLLKQHRVSEVAEEDSVTFFALLTDRLTAAGYEHYEISNFCKPGRHSRHNSSYWSGVPYLGCGPSAHSFDGESREWNVASLTDYLKAAQAGTRLFETEQLDLYTRYNERLLTRLRTRRGVPMEQLKTLFGDELYRYCLKMAAPYLEANELELREGALCLTRKGIFVSDGIISSLMWV